MTQLKKILFTATVSQHLRAFHIPYLAYFRDLGYTVHTAASGDGLGLPSDGHCDIPFSRNPFSIRNLRAYLLLRKLLYRERYDAVHCHTPVAAALTRLAARRLRKDGLKVIYTCHGFHFYQGGPRPSGLLYRCVEKWLSRYTDAIIAVNHEDFNAVKAYNFTAKNCYLCRGMGADGSRFFPPANGEKEALRKSLGIASDAFAAVFAGELNRNKNQRLLVEAAALLKDRIPTLFLILPGEGPERRNLERRIEQLGLAGRILLPGYRTDLPELLRSADVALSSSRREGLPLNIIEAMLTGLPIIATRIRGHTDLIADGESGFLVPLTSPESLAERLVHLHDDPALRERMGNAACSAAASYSLSAAKASMLEIYEDCLK